jgi:hypothetical protein
VTGNPSPVPPQASTWTGSVDGQSASGPLSFIGDDVTDILTRLAAPFPPDRISWRVGPMTADKSKGQALCYIDARDVMARLDEVFGDQWQCENVPMHNGTTCCRIGLPVGPSGEVRWRTDGAGATGNVDDEKQREMAEKGGYSDAFKRAAVQWGVGRYLYDIDCPWVELDDRKRIKPHEQARLKTILGNVRPANTPPPLPKKDARAIYSALSLGLKQCGCVEDLAAFWKLKQAEIAALPDDWRQNLTTEKDDLKGLFAARLAA